MMGGTPLLHCGVRITKPLVWTEVSCNRNLARPKGRGKDLPARGYRFSRLHAHFESKVFVEIYSHMPARPLEALCSQPVPHGPASRGNNRAQLLPIRNAAHNRQQLAGKVLKPDVVAHSALRPHRGMPTSAISMNQPI
jgi:hypothetical protein